MKGHVTDAELVEVLKLIDDCGGNISEAARKHGLNRPHLSAQVSLAKARGLTPKTIIRDPVPALETKIKLLQRELQLLKKHNESAAAVRREIYGLKELSPDPPQWIIELKKPKHTGVPVTIWSDWHWGERVDAASMAGVNEFNRRIAKDRVRRLIAGTIDLAINHMVNPQYPGIVVCLGGDMITGGIHDELRETNDGTVQQSLLEVQEQLIWGLSTLADTFGGVFCPCVVGNHGRSSLRPRFKEKVYESLEWNLYCQLELYFRNDSRIQFFVPGETDAHFTVLGHRFHLTHGDCLGVKGGDGIIGAIGPIARGATKLGRSEATIGRDFDTLLLGHWHTYIPRGDATPVAVNGSLIGYNEYARLQLRVPYSRPSQSLMFIHEKHGFTAQWPIYLDDRRKSADTADWVKWEKRRTT